MTEQEEIKQAELEYQNLLDNLGITFIKNTYIDVTLNEFYNTYSKTLNTGRFVPEKYNNYIHKYIFKCLKKKFKQVNKLAKKKEKQFKKNIKIKNKTSDITDKGENL